MGLPPELTITSPCVHSIVESQHIYHGQPYARVDFIAQSGTLDLASELCVWKERCLDLSRNIHIFYGLIKSWNPTFTCREINKNQSK